MEENISAPETQKSKLDSSRLFQQIFLCCSITGTLLLGFALGITLHFSISTFQTQLDDMLKTTALSLADSAMVREAYHQGYCTDEMIHYFDTLVDTADNMDVLTLSDCNLIRLYHVNHALIGEEFVGGDQGDALAGKSYFSDAIGTLANWLGHCMSDVAGSKGSARNGRRGMGLAMPGTEVLMFSGLKVGKEEELLGNVMTEAFRRGYDFRVGVAQGLVLGFQKAATAVCWAFKRHYLDGRPWTECVPLEREGSLRMMQLVGNGALCMVDAGNAALKSGGEPVEFVLNFNFSVALQLAYLVLHEFDVRMGIELEKRMDALYDEVLHVSTPLERRNIQKMDERLRNYQLSLDQKYLLFCVQVEGSEAEFMQTLKATDAWYASMHKRADASAEHARAGGVKEEKILNSVSELDVKLGVERKKGFLERFKKR